MEIFQIVKNGFHCIDFNLNGFSKGPDGVAKILTYKFDGHRISWMVSLSIT
jgi:hypothetical protein